MAKRSKKTNQQPSQPSEERPISQQPFRGLLAALWNFVRPSSPPSQRPSQKQSSKSKKETGPSSLKYLKALSDAFPEKVQKPGQSDIETLENLRQLYHHRSPQMHQNTMEIKNGSDKPEKDLPNKPEKDPPRKN